MFDCLLRNFSILFLVLFLSSCGGGGGGGSDSTDGQTQQFISSDQFKGVSQDYLSSISYDTLRFFNDPSESVVCTSYGRIESGQLICLVYGVSEYSTFNPAISNDIDLIVYVPTNSEASINDLFASLGDSEFQVVVENRISLGNIDYASSISGDPIIVRNIGLNIPRAQCEILNSENISLETFDLLYTSTGIFEIPDNLGYGLSPAEYKIRCNISNLDESEIIVDVYDFQVISTNNTAPVVNDVMILEEDQLLTFNGLIRDTNQSLTISVGDVSDQEDDLLGLMPNVEGYVSVGGNSLEVFEIIDFAFDVDLMSLSGEQVDFGVEATDSLGAITRISVSRPIHENLAPSYQSGLQDLSCFVGQTLSLPPATYLDPEGDEFEYEYTQGEAGIFNCDAAGEYRYATRATDVYGALSDLSTEFNIEVVEGNRPPVITRGGFVEDRCLITFVLSCDYTVTLPTCSDPDGNLGGLPVVYQGSFVAESSYSSGGTVTDNFTARFHTVSAYCVDDEGAVSDTLETVIEGCVYDAIRGTCRRSF